MGVAIAFDHRIIDGVTGAAFRRYLAYPGLLTGAASSGEGSAVVSPLGNLPGQGGSSQNGEAH